MGKKTLSYLLQSENYATQTIIATLISSREYHRVVNEYAPKRATSMALFSDPSPVYQMRLAAALLKKPRLAFVYDHHDEYVLPLLMRTAKNLKLPAPVFIHYEPEFSINDILDDPHFMSADALLAMPNSAMYNRDTIKHIVFTLLNRKQALIGYSSGWVASGALASVYSDKNALAQSLANYLMRLPHQNQHPVDYDIAMNQQIAKILGISLLEKEEIQQRLHIAEQNKHHD